MRIENLITRTALALCALCFVQLTTSSVLAQASVTTDKEDYPPYSVVWISSFASVSEVFNTASGSLNGNGSKTWTYALECWSAGEMEC